MATLCCRIISLSLCLMLFHDAHSLDNGLALTPPMGWNSWLEFHCDVNCAVSPNKCLNEKNIREIADRMASDGYKDAGYQYISIDDCWMNISRGPDGRQVSDPSRFPSGMKALADYIHKKGLKLGIYTDIGHKTCAGRPGSQNFLELDAQTYADWGIDYLKVDGCNIDDRAYISKAYKELGAFLNRTNRPILYSSEWPAYDLATVLMPNYTDIRAHCNMWRTFLDMQASWNGMLRILAFWAVNPFHISKYAGPGGWNDPDVLIVGNKVLTPDQETLQMTMWAMIAAPMLISADPRNISTSSKRLLLNKSLLAISQDSLGIAGTMVKAVNMLQFWKRPISPAPTTYAVAVLNLDPFESITVLACMTDFNLKLNFAYEITDVLTSKTLCVNCSCIPVSIRPTSVSIMKVMKHLSV